MPHLTKTLLIFIMLLPLHSLALETDWLEMEVGFEGKTIGAKLKSIEAAPEADQKLITVAIPKKSIDNDKDMEEIVVIGHQPDKKDFTIPVSYEWAKDFDNDYYGLIIKIGKESTYPIRIYFKGDIEQDVSPNR